MNFQTEFAPPKRKGTILYLGLTLLLLGLSGSLLIFALDQQSSGFFVLALLGAILVLVPIPFILYSLYSLVRARYGLDREGLKIHWGLRGIDIPMPDIDWVRTADTIQKKLPLPAWSFSGLLRGVVNSAELGEVEFLASDQNRLVLVGTPKKVYAISPEKSNDFLKAFQSAFELGSITPLKARSNQAGAYFSSVLKDRMARIFVFLDLLLLAALLITTAILISSRQTVIFGYQPAGVRLEPAPSDRLLLLPALNFFSLVAVFTAGFFFFRNPQTRNLSYVTLASGLITPILFFLALLFIK
jgi:hypothetical protein